MSRPTDCKGQQGVQCFSNQLRCVADVQGKHQEPVISALTLKTAISCGWQKQVIGLSELSGVVMV
jgi:hypothetical protein